MNRITAHFNRRLRRCFNLFNALHSDTQLAVIISGYYHLLLFLVILIGSMLARQQPLNASTLYPFHSWDAKHYLFIAEYGYPQSPQADANVIAFFPFYPALIAILTFTGLPYLMAGLILTWTGSFIAQVGIFELARKHFSVQIAWRSFWFLLITPIAMYFTSTHTEGLFLGLTVLFFLLLDRKQFWLAAVIGLCASLTRLPGITLVIPFALGLLTSTKHRKKFSNYLGLLLIPCGYLAYLGINWQVFNNPFYYQRVLEMNWYKTIANPLQTIPAFFIYFVQGVTGQIQLDSLNFMMDIGWVFALPILSGIFVLLKGRLPLGWWGWMIANWLIIVSQSYWLSSTRYILALFPLYLMLGYLTQKFPWLLILFTGIFSILLVYGVQRFVLGLWVY